uniref:Uncharacterized protein n=1 Tax=Anguilla anguilla TaxID=7936 RepID=A0A0E9TI40_ANGAN
MTTGLKTPIWNPEKSPVQCSVPDNQECDQTLPKDQDKGQRKEGKRERALKRVGALR